MFKNDDDDDAPKRLSCKILITTIFMFICIKQLTSYFGSNNCYEISKFHENNCKRIVLDKYYYF